MGTRIRHHQYNARKEFDRGAPMYVELCWYLCKCVFFLSAFPWPARLRVIILRLFGAEVGRNVYIKPRANIHFPWRLKIGDHSLVGEEVFILNFEQVTIGEQCCLSQRVFICTGNHDYRDPLFPYRNAPITVGDGVWIGAQSFLSPGVVIGDEAVITAGSIVRTAMPEGMICSGNPCAPIKTRWLEESNYEATHP